MNEADALDRPEQRQLARCRTQPLSESVQVGTPTKTHVCLCSNTVSIPMSRGSCVMLGAVMTLNTRLRYARVTCNKCT